MAGIVFFWLSSKTEKGINDNDVELTFPDLDTQDVTTVPGAPFGYKYVIGGGKNILIADIRALPETKDVGSGMFHLEISEIEPTAKFALLYSENDDSFSLAVLDSPVSYHRDRASEYMLILLKISKEEACQLNFFVGVPYDIDSNLSGINLGLSFCPGSVPL